MANDCYVYVYIDPRNFEDFYFGKGRGARKNAHLIDSSDSEKARRIRAIRNAGLEPIVRVIARGLSDHDALLVEKTLLWKLGKQRTNVAGGHYSENFRPHDTLHMELSGFDFRNRIYYYNVGEGEVRDWDDYRKYGFISAGQGKRWRDAMLGFRKGDIIAAYLKGHGFVGIGRVLESARRIREAQIGGRPLLSLSLTCSGMDKNADSEERSEYVAPVKWIVSLERNEAKWKPKAGLYTTTHVRASLDGQPKTVAFLEKAFGVNVCELADSKHK
jgi:uncharacterized protein